MRQGRKKWGRERKGIILGIKYKKPEFVMRKTTNREEKYKKMGEKSEKKLFDAKRFENLLSVKIREKIIK